jgi:hypothetical protein
MEEYSKKISIANKGKAKPIGFAENMSLTRQGINNPNAKELEYYIVGIKGKKAIVFKYGFQINNYLNKKDGYGNVLKALKKDIGTPYGIKWIYYYEELKYVYDIVQYTSES